MQLTLILISIWKYCRDIKKLNLAPYKGFVNPVMTPLYDDNGNIKDVKVDYSESYTHQMLRYSKEYGYL
jgi:dipeptidyl-peptidase-3